MKYKFTKQSQSGQERLSGLDWERFNSELAEKPIGWKGELLLRAEVRWDIEKMRKYFEGPCVEFVRELYAQQGMALGKGEIREMLKEKFLGHKEDKFGMPQPTSTTTLDYTGFHELLKHVNEWCMDKFNCELPAPEMVE